MAQIPNPLPRSQGDGRELRVIRQTAVQTTGQAQSRPQGVDHIAAHLQRQPSTGGGQAHHRHLGAIGQGRLQIGHHGNGALNARDRLQRRAGMGRVNHRDDRPGAIAQHRQAGFAREVVQTAVLQQHHGTLSRQHQPTSWTPRPGRSAGASRSPWRSGPEKGSSTRLRWLSRSGQCTKGSSWAAPLLSKPPSE